jgi:two-component system chemotaxis response regulator CheY
VNRVSDADGSPGIELIRALKADPGLAGVPVMLVSNYADAQAQAVALGALPGFGKADLTAPETTEKLRSALGSE